jgi:terminal uridylyltransferase
MCFRNLQRLKSQYSLDSDTAKYDGHDISFFDDLDALKAVWSSNNTDNVGDLLIDFFRFFAKEFSYSNQVISIRSETGVLSKDSKGWPNDVSRLLD